MSQPSQTLAPEAFRSAGEVRTEHSNLLQRRGSTGPIAEAEVIAFLKAVSATGHLLPDSDPDARESVRGILDYWTATLLSMNPQLAREAPSYLLLQPYQQEEVQALEAHFESQDAELSQVIDLAGLFTDQASKKQKQLLGKLLLRLVHLKKGSVEPYTALVQPSDLDDLAEKAVCDELLKMKILVSRQEDGQLTLRHEKLFTEWPFLAERIKHRREFREFAISWRKGNRSAAALLNRGKELEEAKSYRDLEPVENDFLAGSLAREKGVWNDRLIAAGIAIVVLLGMTVWIYMKYQDVDKKNIEVTTQADQLEDQKKELEVLVKDRDKAIAGLRAKEIIDQQQKEELQKQKVELEARGRDLTSARDKLAAEKDEALEKLKLLTTSLEDAAKYKVKADLLEQQITQVANNIAEGKSFAPQAREILTTYRTGVQDDTKKATEEITHAPLAQSLANFDLGTQQALQPGNGISTRSKSGESRGSLGVFVQDAANNLYIVSPAYILSGGAGTPVFTGREKKEAQIGTVSGITSLDASDLTNLGLVKLNAGVPASNVVDGLGEIKGIEPNPVHGMEVILLGSGSGISEGKILDTRNDGTIVTDRRISQPGDEGAPVIAKGSKRLVGLLISSTTDTSILKSIKPLLAEHGLKIYQTTPATKNDFSGVLAEIFVSADNALNITRAAKYVKALQMAGVRLPVPEAQPRNKVPSTISEVRYFYENSENKAIAEKVMAELIQAGLPANKVRVYPTPDATAPQRFIQISLAKAAFAASPPRRR